MGRRAASGGEQHGEEGERHVEAAGTHQEKMDTGEAWASMPQAREMAASRYRRWARWTSSRSLAAVTLLSHDASHPARVEIRTYARQQAAASNGSDPEVLTKGF